MDPMDSRLAAVLLILAGLTLVGLGVLVYVGGFSWFGRLPGDFRFERGAVKIFLPITSMILLSVVLTILLTLLRRFF